MLAMLPGGVTTALAALGVHTGSGPLGAVGRAVGPAAQPLFVAGVIAMAVGALRCGASTVALVTGGGALAYLSMYVVNGRGALGGMAGMPGMDGTSAGVAAGNAPMFYAGLALIVASFGWSSLRRRSGRCRPVWRGQPTALTSR